MMREEWTALTGHNPTPEQWEVIETVYTWHPSIPASPTSLARSR